MGWGEIFTVAANPLVEGQFTGITSSGPLDILDAEHYVFRNVTATITRKTGSSTWAVRLEGSLDGNTWADLGTASQNATSAPVNATSRSWRYYRINVLSVGSGNTLDILLRMTS
jgi:hypothetical protein